MSRGMSRGDLGRRLAAAAVSVVLCSLTLTASGCALVGDPQEPTSRADGDNLAFRGIQLRNVFVLGPRPGETLPPGGTAAVYLTMNSQRTEPDRLVSVEAPDVAGSVQLIEGPLEVPPGELVDPGAQGPAIVLENLTRPVRGGETVRLRFRFADAGTLEASVPVMPYADFYTTYPAAPSRTASPAP